MAEATGWLLDVYAEEDGITLWLLTDDAKRLCLHMDFDITFYAAGDFSLLRQAWIYLKEKDVRLERTIRRDLFLGERDVMAVTTSNPAGLQKLFGETTTTIPIPGLLRCGYSHHPAFYCPDEYTSVGTLPCQVR